MKRALLATAFALTAGSAQAALVNFDLTSFSGQVATHASTVDGVTLSVAPTGGNITRSGNGFGVRGNPEGGRLGAGETLSFGITDAIDSLTFEIFETQNQDEDFRITVNGTSLDFTIPGGTGGGSFVTFDVSALIPTGGVTAFSITGLEANAPGNRGIRVAAISVNTIDLATVPLPSGSALLLTGLLGFGALRRNR